MSKKQKRLQKKAAKQEEDDFRIDLQDKRFAAIMEDPKFGIDPNDPKFKKTKVIMVLQYKIINLLPHFAKDEKNFETSHIIMNHALTLWKYNLEYVQ